MLGSRRAGHAPPTMLSAFLPPALLFSAVALALVTLLSSSALLVCIFVHVVSMLGQSRPFLQKVFQSGPSSEKAGYVFFGPFGELAPEFCLDPLGEDPGLISLSQGFGSFSYSSLVTSMCLYSQSSPRLQVRPPFHFV